MKAHITKSPIGYFAFDDDQKLLFYNLFKTNPREIAAKIKDKIDDNFICKAKGFEIVEDEFAKRTIRKRLREYAISLGFSKSSKDLTEFLSEFSMEINREKLKNSIKKDAIIVQASNSLESMNKFINILTEHFKEWLWLNYPEYKDENEKIIQNMIKYGSREKFPGFKGSYGIEFEEDDKNIVKDFAIQLDSLIKLKKDKEKYIRSLVKEVAPNFSYLVDELIAARMIAIAGSLANLSKMPTSTIQLLGAEKALFRHLKNRKSKPPKFGVLFESSYVKSAPMEKKGKVARIMSSYLSKAARVDFYSKRDEKEKLKKEMEEEINRELK